MPKGIGAMQIILANWWDIVFEMYAVLVSMIWPQQGVIFDNCDQGEAPVAQFWESKLRFEIVVLEAVCQMAHRLSGLSSRIAQIN